MHKAGQLISKLWTNHRECPISMALFWSAAQQQLVHQLIEQGIYWNKEVCKECPRCANLSAMFSEL